MDTVILLASFGLLAVASERDPAFGVFAWFPLLTITRRTVRRRHRRFVRPRSDPSSSASEQLRFVDEISLAVIVFVAGSELYLKEIKPRLRPILGIASGIIAVTYVVLAVGVFLLTGLISFTSDLGDGAKVGDRAVGRSRAARSVPAVDHRRDQRAVGSRALHPNSARRHRDHGRRHHRVVRDDYLRGVSPRRQTRR